MSSEVVLAALSVGLIAGVLMTVWGYRVMQSNQITHPQPPAPPKPIEVVSLTSARPMEAKTKIEAHGTPRNYYVMESPEEVLRCLQYCWAHRSPLPICGNGGVNLISYRIITEAVISLWAGKHDGEFHYKFTIK